MENQEKTIDDYATEYAESVASTYAEEKGSPMPVEFVHLLVTAYVAGHNHVGMS